MADYIRREDALKALYNDYAYAAMDVIKRLPAADVAEVVRCRDCIYRIDGRCFSRTSFLNAPAVEPDNFCSWGATE
jgi:hypothetical protein